MLINPGYIYQPNDFHHLRFSYAYATFEQLEEGIKILTTLVQSKLTHSDEKTDEFAFDELPPVQRYDALQPGYAIVFELSANLQVLYLALNSFITSI